jgi:hypothetical protein
MLSSSVKFREQTDQSTVSRRRSKYDLNLWTGYLPNGVSHTLCFTQSVLLGTLPVTRGSSILYNRGGS